MKAAELENLDRAFKTISLARRHARIRGTGTMPCPICKAGTITYRKLPPYGRFAGECSSPKCVKWGNL
jgi:hypothetical protein